MSAPTFTRAPRVSSGQALNSSQYRGLARAFNDRLRLIGDLPWRISWYWYTLWRQVRNPDSSGFAFPPQGEWFDIYAHIDPDYTSMEWPVAGPGEPEGANLGNPAMQAILGVEGGPDDEPTRAQIPMARPATLAGYWALGKDQRGCYDPATTAMNAPAFDAALAQLQFYQSGLVPMHKGWGGWQPQPATLLENCGSTESTGLRVPSYEIFFTALKADAATAALHGAIGADGEGRTTATYAGTCPCGSEVDNTGHVLGVVRHPLFYIVYVCQGPTTDCGVWVDYLSTRDWIEGPYEAEPYLAHTDGGQIARAVHAAVADFRGSAAQRAGDEFQIEAVAFAGQEFFTRQYALAPARGQLAGTILQEIYPTCTLISTGTLLANALGLWAPGQTEYSTAPGFVVAGWYAHASGLAGPAILEVLDGDTRIGAVTLQPDGNGAAEDLRWLATAVPASRLRIRPVADVPLRSGGAGSIIIEIAELLAWKPFYWDAYIVTRNGASFGGDQLSAGVDGRGVDCEKAPDLTRDLFRYGCLVNDDATALRPQADWVNDNPLYDAARRLTRSQVRITPRRQLVDYEVTGDGRCALFFKRFSYGMANSRLDMFDGIAPPVSPIWSLEEGERYIVHGTSGVVTYRGANQAIGSVFTAGAEPTFQVSGDARVYVYDGIRHTARKRGTTNEWVMLLETKCYHPSESSLWKASAYSDYFTWNNRCLFYPWVMPAVVRQQVAVQYGVSMDGDTFALSRLPMSVQASVLAPEAPTGYSYSAGTNSSPTPAEEFCRSCRIYESPYEIESCTVDDWGADQVVKVVLKSRLRSHPDAPGTVSRGAGAWSSGTVSDLAAESFRTDDNAVREYLRHQADGNFHCSWKTGDAASGSLAPFLPDNPFGSCYPTFHFVRLIPEPYEDGNSSQEPTDTRAVAESYQQMEAYLRVICEAFVDGRTSADLVCRLSGGDIYDYTFENLCFDAFGGRGIGAFGLADREDDPPGFGPLPNTLIYAQTHNRLAAGVDLLTKIRVDIPAVVSFRAHNGSASKEVLGSESCTTTGPVALYIDNEQPAAVGSVTPGIWDVTSLPVTLIADQLAAIEGCPWELVTDRTDQEWKVEVDSAYSFALPDWLQAMFDAARIRMISRTVHTQTRYARQGTDLAGSDECCRSDHLPCPGHWNGGGGTYWRWVAATTSETICGDAAQGTIRASTPPRSDFNIGRDTDMNPGTWCSVGAADRLEVTIFDSTPYVEFQLTDPA